MIFKCLFSLYSIWSTVLDEQIHVLMLQWCFNMKTSTCFTTPILHCPPGHLAAVHQTYACVNCARSNCCVATEAVSLTLVIMWVVLYFSSSSMPKERQHVCWEAPASDVLGLLSHMFAQCNLESFLSKAASRWLSQGIVNLVRTICLVLSDQIRL